MKTKKELKEITLYLGHARNGKTWKLKEHYANNPNKNKSLFTLAHRNRLKIATEIKQQYDIDITLQTDVEAAIQYNTRTWENAEFIYIDEIGLFTNESHLIVGRNWIGKKHIIATGDVHQIINSKLLYKLIFDALKQGNKDDLKKYNKYAGWDGLTISDDDIKKHKIMFKDCTVKIVYASYPAPRQNLDTWDRDGDKPFLNRITLQEAVKQDYKILTATTATRDFVINMIHPDWINNIYKGQLLFCKENDRGSKQSKRYFNGLNYVIYEYDNNEYILHEENGTNNNTFKVSKSELYSHFQPPNVICVAKGQGSDFKDVLMYVREDDIKAVNKHLMYTACSRARENYEIIYDGSSTYNFLLMCQKTIGHNRRTRTDNTIFRQDEIRQFFSNSRNLEEAYCIKNVFYIYKYYKENVCFLDETVKYRQFVDDFNFLYPEYKFEEKPKEKEDLKGAKIPVERALKLLVSDLKNYNHAQREKALLKLLNINNKENENTIKKQEECTSYIYSMHSDEENLNSCCSFYSYLLDNEDYYFEGKMIDYNYQLTQIEKGIIKEQKNNMIKELLYKNDISKTSVLLNLVDANLYEINNNGRQAKTEDLVTFLNMWLGKCTTRNNYFYQFGVQIQKRYKGITFNDAWLLAVHYLYYYSIIDANYRFTPDMSDKVDKYKNQLRAGLDMLPTEKQNTNKTKTVTLTNKNTSAYKWNFIDRTIYNKTYTDYEGNISGRFTPQRGKATIPTSQDWETTPTSIVGLYGMNLFNTNWIVIDVDGDDKLTDKQQYCIDWSIKNRQQYYETTTATTKHKTGGHIWVNIGDLRLRRIPLKGIDILGNATNQPVWIKDNKYPKGFNPNTDLTVTPPIGFNELKSLVDYLKKES